MTTRFTSPPQLQVLVHWETHSSHKRHETNHTSRPRNRKAHPTAKTYPQMGPQGTNGSWCSLLGTHSRYITEYDVMYAWRGEERVGFWGGIGKTTSSVVISISFEFVRLGDPIKFRGKRFPLGGYEEEMIGPLSSLSSGDMFR